MVKLLPILFFVCHSYTLKGLSHVSETMMKSELRVFWLPTAATTAVYMGIFHCEKVELPVSFLLVLMIYLPSLLYFSPLLDSLHHSLIGLSALSPASCHVLAWSSFHAEKILICINAEVTFFFDNSVLFLWTELYMFAREAASLTVGC